MTDGTVDESVVGRIFRGEAGRSLAAVIGFCGDIDLAEDAVQDAFTLALRKWPAEGLPPNPGGWITTTARNRAVDRLRRDARGRELAGDLARNAALEVPVEVDTVPDDRLRLMFTCCHPALSAETQVALTLRLLGGLSTTEVASAFLVAEPAMAQRLVRAKRKIRAARIPYRVPEAAELPGRLRAVLTAVYLIYNAGHTDPDPAAALPAEAIRLARMLAELMPDEPEVTGLLALVLLVESRRAARSRADGSFVPLGEQDRARWNHALIAEGQALVRRCLRRDRPGPYQLQAAIQAVHTDAAARTDWPQILTLYDHLLALAPTPIVALNRAIAVGEVHGPGPALALVDELDLGGYCAFHATRADLLRRLGRHDDAVTAYQRAAVLAPTDAERDFLRRGGRSGRSATTPPESGGRTGGGSVPGMASTPRLTLAELPPAARAIASAATDAVAAAQAGDAAAFDDAGTRLLLTDPEHVRVILGDAVRLLLEEVLPDGVDGDDLREIIGRCARSAAPWFPEVDPGVLVVVLSGALGIHPDTPPEPRAGEERPPEPDDPWDAVPPRPSPAAVTQHAVVLLADLLAARGRPLRGYLEAAFTEVARRETVEQP